MNNLTTSIAFSIHSNKGVYALLLGSGISKSAGVPTGWDILIDLIKQLAKVNKSKCEPNPSDWFRKQYHDDPDYSVILSKLVATPTERVNLLKQYFEPASQDEENILKQPSQAHRSIAKLVKDGYIKVIITTNFDRLVETALINEGIEPTIIKHPTDIDGSIPLTHNKITLIKINGDYLDSRFLNTKEELKKYEQKLNNYLLQIINEYGIISCGWSAKWDTGLVNILKQCENFRFSSYWTYLNNCEKELTEIASQRKGQTIKIENADSFFNEIVEKIDALETLNEPSPLNVEVSLARLKKYLPRDDSKILLYDLIRSEQEVVYNKIRNICDFMIRPDQDYLLPKITEFESSLKILLPVAITTTYWCKDDQYYHLENILSRIAEPPPNPSGPYFDQTRNFYYLPTFLILYAIGITAIKVKKYDLLNNCFRIKIPELPTIYSNKIYIIEKINPNLIDKDLLNLILNARYHTPLSTLGNKILKPYFKDFISNETEFDDIYDVFEYLLSLYFMLLTNRILGDWAPIGQYQWRSSRLPTTNSNLLKEFLESAEKKKSDWIPIKQGMFDGDYNIYSDIKTRLDNFRSNIHMF